MRTALYTLSMLATLCMAFGCQSVRDLGSSCPGGACMQTASNSATAVPCLVSNIAAEISFDIATIPCLPRPLTVDEEGDVACTMSLTMNTEDETWCTDRGLSPSAGHPEIAETTCAVPQVSVHDGALENTQTQGWYYDDFSSTALSGCGGQTPQRIALTEGFAMPVGALARLYCTQVVASSEDAAPALDLPVATVDVEISSCVVPVSNSSAGVGEPCLPRAMPETGFSDSQAYLQTGAGDCQTGACLVYHLEGDPRDTCVPSGEPGCEATETEPCPPVVTCPTPEEVDARVFCTCRCDDGEGGGCDCPDGFSCVDSIDNVSTRVDGSYCVKNASVSVSG